MAPCDTPEILCIYLWQSPRPGNQQYFNNYRLDIGWHEHNYGLTVICIYWRFTTECNQHKCETHCLLGNWGKSGLPLKRADRDWTNSIIHHKSLAGGRGILFFQVFQEHCIDNDIDFNQLWGNQFRGASRVIPHNWQAVYNPDASWLFTM